MNKPKNIPIYKPFLGDEETSLVTECMKSTWISSQGSFINRFEEKVQEYVGVNHAIAVSNGTVAIHLAMLALGIEKGDEVITTNFTYVASSNSILYVNAKPVFVDIDKDTWNIDVSKIEEKITTKTKAILYTNIYGAPADYENLKVIAEKYNIFLIEDAAESLGARYKNLKSGVLGDIATYSFFGNKTITTGEGGMVLTQNDNLAKKIRKLKNQGNSETVRYYHDILGYNYRMTNIQAAIGVAQLDKIDEILNLKREINEVYRTGLKGYVKFQKIIKESVSSYWMCSILLKSLEQKNKIVDALYSEGIETRPFFTPIDELPFYTRNKGLEVTRSISLRGLNLPSFPALSSEEQHRIIRIIINNIK